MIGRYDTLLIVFLQQLGLANHEVILYLHLSSASNFRDTDERFDTVALHSLDLHRAVESRCTRINWKKVRLTREQKSICNAQGIKLPLLPFATLEEKSLFTRHYSIISKKREMELAIWWCNHVDGVRIFSKATCSLLHASEKLVEKESDKK